MSEKYWGQFMFKKSMRILKNAYEWKDKEVKKKKIYHIDEPC